MAVQRRLGLYLAIFAGGVLVFSALQTSQESVLTVRQAYVNLAVAVVVSFVLVRPFPELVQVFCDVLRFTAPVTALLFLARGRWAYLPPLLLLGLVFHGWAWVAKEMRAGRGASGIWRDLGSRGRVARGRPTPFKPDETGPPAGGTYVVRGPQEAPAGPPPEESPPEDTSNPQA